MIRIITDSGVELEIAPDASFDIEIENPFFTEEIPVPWSTSIAFPLTPLNRKIFGFYDAFLLEPSEKEIQASIYLGGLPMMSGTLKYDSYEEGRLNYCFTGRGFEDDFSVKLFNLEMPCPALSGAATALEVKNRLIRGDVQGVFAPPCINQAKTATSLTAGSNVKFHNYPSSSVGTMVSPAILAQKILETGAPNLDFTVPDDVAVLGLFHDVDNYPLCLADNIAVVLPDITLSEFIQSLCRMYKGAIFKDDTGYKMIRFSSILSDSDVLDLDELIADSVSMSREEAKGYNLEFKDNNPNNSNYDSETTPSGQTVFEYSIDAVLNAMAASGNYIPVNHMYIGDIYSGKREGAQSSITVLDDILFSYGQKASDDSDDMEVCEVGFKLLRVVPFRYRDYTPHGDDVSQPVNSYHNAMMPLITPLKLGEDRPEDVFIGVMAGGYLVDKGRIDIEDDPTYDHRDEQAAYGITPSLLRSRFHTGYASWISKDRQVISIDLNLTELQIAQFRIWKKVSLASRRWIVRKITFSFAGGIDGALTNAELISL